MYGKFEGFPEHSKCIVWVGDIMTPVGDSRSKVLASRLQGDADRLDIFELYSGTASWHHTKWWAFWWIFCEVNKEPELMIVCFFFSGWDGEHGEFFLLMWRSLGWKGIFLMSACWKLKTHSPTCISLYHDISIYYIHIHVHLEPKWPICWKICPKKRMVQVNPSNYL